MRVVIVALGSRGDVQPYVALGLGLQRAGHTVRVVTHTTFATMVHAHGLDYASAVGDPQAERSAAGARGRLVNGRYLLPTIWRARGLIKDRQGVLDQLVDNCWEATQDADAMICSPLGVVGYAVAEKRGIPSVSSAVVPSTRTSAFPHYHFPFWPLGPVYNQLTYELAGRGLRLLLRRMANRRRDRLGLPPLPRRLSAESLGRAHHMLYGFSEAVVPRPPDWPEWVHVTGYWFLDRPDTWQPPEDLVRFLAAGPTPVYVGFGSLPSEDPEGTASLIVEALNSAGKRGVLLSGWGGLRPTSLPETIYLLRDVPFDWLYPRVAAVVHHGGAGTTAAGLRAGIPSIVLPSIGSQPFWAERVAALGVGPHPIPRKRLTAGRLAEAIDQATSDKSMVERATAVGQQIRAEHGVARAVETFERILPTLSPAGT